MDTVDTISSRRVQLAEALLLLECVACVRTVMNSRIGLELIIEHAQYTTKLVKGQHGCSSVDVRSNVSMVVVLYM